MITRQVEVCNKLGLHARAASRFVEVAKEYISSISVVSPLARANGKSIMNMMLLQATRGTLIEITAEGDDEQAAIDALVKLVELRFGETE